MAKQHYPTMRTKDICDLPVRDIKTTNAVCFLWATFPRFRDALAVMKAWDFVYKSAAFVWVKTNPSGSLFWGMGAYTRANAEVCLLGISRGTKASKIVQSHSIHQIVLAPMLRHSAKPPEVRERIVQLVGDLSRIELFARQKSAGWDAWGNEVESDIDLAA